MVKLSSSIHDSNINTATIRFDDGKVVTLYHNDAGNLVIDLNASDAKVDSWSVNPQRDYPGAVATGLKVEITMLPRK